MSLKVTTQQVDTWKKRIQRDGLKGSTYFVSRAELCGYLHPLTTRQYASAF
ncbi:TPA: hypothetical protein QCK25_000156 [Enterobacter mori]|nr:hypothetical protein [Enterobacter mori]